MARWMIRRWGNERKWETRLALALAFFLGAVVGTIAFEHAGASRDSSTAPASAIAGPLSIPAPVELSMSFSSVAKAVEPTVVNINTETYSRRPQSPRRRAPSPFDDFFDRFFEFDQQQPVQSLGSGVLVDAKGFILTNHHVIEGADRVQVRVAGENELYDAEVVGFDEDTDLAVIRIDAGKELPYSKLGNSDASQVGDWVLAIGSPFGLSATVTAGIISYKGRSGQAILDPLGQFKKYIQTDAAINRGNSGGPLVNMAGEVIGINTAIFSPRGVSAGVGFAIPSVTAIDVYNQILEHGRVVRGSIGISFRSAVSQNQAIMRVYGAEHGVQVEDVNPNGPAERAGLRVGDIITHVDDTPIHSGDDLVNLITATPIGKKVRLRYIRDRKNGETRARVEDFRAVHSRRYISALETESDEASSAKFGVSLQDLRAEEVRQLELDQDSRGPMVQRVEPGSFADDIGLVEGDIIVEMNRERIASVREFQEAQRSLDAGDDVALLVLRPTRQPGTFVSLFLGGTLPEGR